ncbi:hypothetical protein JW998_01375, partial [candidate division KSB1 bacterium]|nr:hypothetical protein [candidate division KSB1 bacterium]
MVFDFVLDGPFKFLNNVKHRRYIALLSNNLLVRQWRDGDRALFEQNTFGPSRTTDQRQCRFFI